MTAPPLKGRRMTCANKRRHPDEHTARSIAMDAITRYGTANVLYVYRCPECHGWHLTRNKQGAAVTATNPYLLDRRFSK